MAMIITITTITCSMKWLWRPADDLLLARRVLVPPVGAPVLTVQLKKYSLGDEARAGVHRGGLKIAMVHPDQPWKPLDQP